MSTLRSLVMAQAIVAALAAPSGAAPRARHVPEAPRKAAAVDEGDVGSLDVDAPEPAPPRRQVIAAAVERDAGWHAGITVGADFPVDALNVGFLIQTPSGLRLSSSVGFLTDVFLGLMDSSGDNHADSVMMQAVEDAWLLRVGGLHAVQPRRGAHHGRCAVRAHRSDAPGRPRI
jgi:hypothetical protein